MHTHTHTQLHTHTPSNLKFRPAMLLSPYLCKCVLHVYTCVCTCVYTCMLACAYINMCMCVCVCVYVWFMFPNTSRSLILQNPAQLLARGKKKRTRRQNARTCLPLLSHSITPSTPPKHPCARLCAGNMSCVLVSWWSPSMSAKNPEIWVFVRPHTDACTRVHTHSSELFEAWSRANTF